MLVKFSSTAHGDVTMFGDVAKHLLKLMGQTGNIPGGIYAKDVPAALERLQKAVKTEQQIHKDEAVGQAEEEEGEEARVGIAVRAFPLIEMLKAAAEEGVNIMWYEKK